MDSNEIISSPILGEYDEELVCKAYLTAITGVTNREYSMILDKFSKDARTTVLLKNRFISIEDYVKEQLANYLSFRYVSKVIGDKL